MASLTSFSMRVRCDQPRTGAVARRGLQVCRAEAPATPVATTASSTQSYFVVKNVFKVKEDSYTAFEDMWKSRESHLKEMPGFMRFAMLKCTNIPGRYVSETHWASEGAFKNWAQSSQFKASHGQGDSSKRPNTMTMLEGPPAPEFYETVTTTSMD